MSTALHSMGLIQDLKTKKRDLKVIYQEYLMEIRNKGFKTGEELSTITVYIEVT